MEEQIDQFHLLKGKMENFAELIHNDMNLKMNTALNTVKTFENEKNKLQIESDSIRRQIKELEQSEKELAEDISLNESETDEVKNRLQTYQIRKKQLIAQKEQLLKESSELDNMIKSKETEAQEARIRIDRQRQRDNPEVILYEKLLGLKIDAAKSGILVFEYGNFDDKDMSRTCSLTLDVSQDKFVIIETVPTLDSKTVIPHLQDILNVNNNLPMFIVESRTALTSRSLNVQDD
ncbi:hypothetical protein KAFR_0D00640 [Kazachstania africana CBS 2517]|uniref:Kinetochore protein SPC25 n=1 Tax=Kazachstania africana (strain ATCC 22294 / BCRC 22015 / CBS 2517 / CECT 1963 / NBRC 1671 / NRRL Y-8276) TaxID=1071382 RepID=H2ATL1_KAZAF|nr:hypothetical protein KAFR_0D00640 [Kazachstania africana CBS 2517]CCF57711.1 hypothetical protein KAFR_0D00640 [Kazachstania africana CBS 2517]